MKVSYYRGCYSESINFFHQENKICLISGMTSHRNIHNHHTEMLTLGKTLIENLSPSVIQELYNNYNNNYSSTIIGEQKEELFNYLKNSSLDQLFDFLKELIQSYPPIKEDYISCDGCGDTNVDYEISLLIFQ